MKQLCLILPVVISLIAPVTLVSAGEAKRAVIAFDKEEGFKLTPEAIESLGVRFETLKGGGPWIIPAGALVRLKHSIGVYRRFEGWITLVLVKVVQSASSTAKITSADLQVQDEIATEGTTFLRMTEADLNSDTVDNCSH